jgi:hypothetical protein
LPLLRFFSHAFFAGLLPDFCLKTVTPFSPFFTLSLPYFNFEEGYSGSARICLSKASGRQLGHGRAPLSESVSIPEPKHLAQFGSAFRGFGAFSGWRNISIAESAWPER